MITTLQEFSQLAMESGFPDLFEFTVDGEILDIENMSGQLADAEGDRVIDFKIIKLDDDDNHLETVIKFDGRQLKPFLDVEDIRKETELIKLEDSVVTINERERLLRRYV